MDQVEALMTDRLTSLGIAPEQVQTLAPMLAAYAAQQITVNRDDVTLRVNAQAAEWSSHRIDMRDMLALAFPELVGTPSPGNMQQYYGDSAVNTFQVPQDPGYFNLREVPAPLVFDFVEGNTPGRGLDIKGPLDGCNCSECRRDSGEDDVEDDE